MTPTPWRKARKPRKFSAVYQVMLDVAFVDGEVTELMLSRDQDYSDFFVGCTVNGEFIDDPNVSSAAAYMIEVACSEKTRVALLNGDIKIKVV